MARQELRAEPVFAVLHELCPGQLGALVPFGQERLTLVGAEPVYAPPVLEVSQT
jgi:hypothetical protein